MQISRGKDLFLSVFACLPKCRLCPWPELLGPSVLTPYTTKVSQPWLDTRQELCLLLKDLWSSHLKSAAGKMWFEICELEWKEERKAVWSNTQVLPWKPSFSGVRIENPSSPCKDQHEPEARPGEAFLENSGIYLQSSPRSVIQNLGQCKKELDELQSWVGEDLSGTDPKYLSGWKCCSLRMSTFFLIFYFFQVSAGLTCCLQRTTYCHGSAVICVIPARFVQALGAGTRKTQKWFRGVGGGRFEEMSCPTLWLHRKKKPWKYKCTIKDPETEKQ